MNHRLHVIHTAVTYFYGIAVKDFTESMMMWEMLVNQLHEFLANICSHILAEWRIKPYGFPSSALPIRWLILACRAPEYFYVPGNDIGIKKCAWKWRTTCGRYYDLKYFFNAKCNHMNG